LHAVDPLVPAANHLALAERELDRVAAVAAAVELRPVREPAGVVHLHAAAGDGDGPRAGGDVLVQQPARLLVEGDQVDAQRGGVRVLRRVRAGRRARRTGGGTRGGTLALVATARGEGGPGGGERERGREKAVGPM